MKYAKETKVTAGKSKIEIENILTRYGATSFASGWQDGCSMVAFEMQGRRLKFVLPMPSAADPDIRLARKNGYTDATESVIRDRVEQATKQRWRALLLCIKAKLEAVESGIATFEEEFLAHIMLPDGRTIGKWIAPQIQAAYDNQQMPPLIGSGK